MRHYFLVITFAFGTLVFGQESKRTPIADPNLSAYPYYKVKKGEAPKSAETVQTPAKKEVTAKAGNVKSKTQRDRFWIYDPFPNPGVRATDEVQSAQEEAVYLRQMLGSLDNEYIGLDWKLADRIENASKLNLLSAEEIAYAVERYFKSSDLESIRFPFLGEELLRALSRIDPNRAVKISRDLLEYQQKFLSPEESVSRVRVLASILSETEEKHEIQSEQSRALIERSLRAIQLTEASSNDFESVNSLEQTAVALGKYDHGPSQLYAIERLKEIEGNRYGSYSFQPGFLSAQIMVDIKDPVVLEQGFKKAQIPDDLKEFVMEKRKVAKDSEPLKAQVQSKTKGKTISELVSLARSVGPPESWEIGNIIASRFQTESDQIIDLDLLDLMAYGKEPGTKDFNTEIISHIIKNKGINIGRQLDREIFLHSKSSVGYAKLALSIRYHRLKFNPSWSEGAVALEESIEILNRGQVEASFESQALVSAMVDFLVGSKSFFKDSPVANDYVRVFAKTLQLKEITSEQKKLLIETLYETVLKNPPPTVELDGILELSYVFARDNDLKESEREKIAAVLSLLLKRIEIKTENKPQVEQIVENVRSGLQKTTVYETNLSSSPFTALADEALKFTLNLSSFSSLGNTSSGLDREAQNGREQKSVIVQQNPISSTTEGPPSTTGN